MKKGHPQHSGLSLLSFTGYILIFISHEYSTRGRDADGVEQLGMPQRQLDQLPNLRELSLAAADVVVPDLVETLVVIALQNINTSKQIPKESTTQRIKNHQDNLRPRVTKAEEIVSKHAIPALVLVLVEHGAYGRALPVQISMISMVQLSAGYSMARVS